MKSEKKNAQKESEIDLTTTRSEPKKRMYRTPVMQKGNIEINNSVEGQTIEEKIEKMLLNKGKAIEGEKSPLVYQERKAGINAAYNIRTDRWEIAIEAGDRIAASYKARREETPKMEISKGGNEEDGEAKSTHGESGTADTK